MLNLAHVHLFISSRAYTESSSRMQTELKYNTISMRSVICLFAVFLLSELSCSAAIEPAVTIDQGTLQGNVDESRLGKSFIQFLGIPYSTKPERFQEGSEAPKWNDTRDATKYRSPCPQFDPKTQTVIGNENCLFLNIFTPNVVAINQNATEAWNETHTKRKLPVIVHMSQNGAMFGPKYLLDEDVVLVTFNYRLSVFGFFSTGDRETTANLGLRDQIRALKWVAQNIHHFDGDPSKVTLYGGGSDGGSMASYLMLSPLAKGLFRSVISTSGNALCPWAVVHKPENIAEKLAAELNCSTNANSSKNIVTCVKEKSVEEIENARVALQGIGGDPAMLFAPVVESWLNKDVSSIPVISEPPEKLMLEGKYKKVPWLSGINSLDGVDLDVATILASPKRLAQLDQEWEKNAPIIFHYGQTAPDPNNISHSIRGYYFGKGNISKETRDTLISALTDRNFIHCTAKAASLLSKHSQVYLYYMNYNGTTSFIDEWGIRDKLNLSGALNGDELHHLFNQEMGSFPVIKPEDKHFPFSEKVVKLWASFAETGIPMEETEKALAEWSPVPPNTSPHALQWYDIGSGAFSHPIVLDGMQQSALWDNLELGSYKTPQNNKFTIGYEMENNSFMSMPIVLIDTNFLVPSETSPETPLDSEFTTLENTEQD